jgi:hypothetical protein
LAKKRTEKLEKVKDKGCMGYEKKEMKVKGVNLPMEEVQFGGETVAWRPNIGAGENYMRNERVGNWEYGFWTKI